MYSAEELIPRTPFPINGGLETKAPSTYQEDYWGWPGILLKHTPCSPLSVLSEKNGGANADQGSPSRRSGTGAGDQPPKVSTHLVKKRLKVG